MVVEALECRTLLAAPHPLELGTLDGTNGFVLTGVDPGDLSGFSVSNAGDVNGDGFDDLLIGAPIAMQDVALEGESYVVFGKSGAFTASLELSSLDGTNGFVITGIDAGDRSGYSVSRAGDVNGDGFADLLIGADRADQPGGSAEGETYVVFGKSDWSADPSLALSDLDGTNGFVITGIDSSDRSGASVSGAGDVNGDGFDDLLIGAEGADQTGGNSGEGESYVVFGKSGGFSASLALSSLDGTNGFVLTGIDPSDHSGISVSGAGDINGDGFSDLIIGAEGADQAGGTGHGESYVVFGKLGGFSASLSLSSLDGTNGFALTGIDPDDLSGTSVSGAGDVNGDGFDDLLIGAEGADQVGGSGQGESYVVFGKSGGFGASLALSSLDGTNGFVLTGIDIDDLSGISVSRAGDVNGDGYDDLLIGASRADQAGGSARGESYVVFGKSGGFSASLSLSSLDGTNGFALAGIDPDDRSGSSVSSAGDVNGDGFDDLLIGALEADQSDGEDHGESYVVFGGNFTGGAETQVGTAAADALTATQGGAAVDILIGGPGNDTLVSDGGPDVLRGGEGDDILAIPDADFSSTRRVVGGTGADLLRLDGAGVVLDLTAIADNRLTGIEHIDITGTGDNSLVVNPQEVLNLSGSSNTLTVRRNAGDSVNMGPGWTQQADESIGPYTFEVFTQGAATIKVQVPGAVVPIIIDDGDSGYSDTGNWQLSPVVEGRDGDVRFAPAGTGSRVATYEFTDLTPGANYDVAATWTTHANRATNAPYTILDSDGVSVLASTLVNQELPPDDFSADDSDWEKLGLVTVSGTTLTVQLSNAADQYVIADAIRVMETEEAPPLVVIIDDGETGYIDSGWTPSPVIEGFGDDLRFTGAGDGSNTATWTFTGLTPGHYRVSATWDPHPNRATNAPFSIQDGVAGDSLATTIINQELPPDDLVANGGSWEDLAIVTITGSELVVELSNAANEYVIADAVRIEQSLTPPPPPAYLIIDDGDTGYADTGWAQSPLMEGRLNDLRYVPGGNGSSVATWTFTGLTPGNYAVAATWKPHANRATNAPFTIYDGIGGQMLETVLVDQEQTPADFNANGSDWEDLTIVAISGTELVVELTNAANQYVIADAIRIAPTTDAPALPPGTIIDDGDAGFSTTVTGWSTSLGEGRDDDIRYTGPGNGSRIATWTLTGLAAGTYRVSATWSPHTNRATDAPYTLYDGAVSLGSVAVNQRLAPDDFTTQGSDWKDLMEVEVTSGTLVVELSNDADGYVVADAIRVQPVT